MLIKTFFPLILMLFISSGVFAQESLSFEIPEFKCDKDYAAFHDEALSYIEWLENNPIDHEKRNAANKILLVWLEGTPTVTVCIQFYLTDYIEKNSEFLMLFMAGWAEYVIQNPEQGENVLQGNLAGINNVLDFYKKGKSFGVKKDKNIEKLLKKRKDGKLKKFISYRMYE